MSQSRSDLLATYTDALALVIKAVHARRRVEARLADMHQDDPHRLPLENAVDRLTIAMTVAQNVAESMQAAATGDPS